VTLIDRAAALLARREPVTLVRLVKDCGVSTMAVYTYFDGMPGLWSAVRQEGFTRLAERLSAVRTHRDPVGHLAALGVAYAEHALTNPDLDRVMFDSAFELLDVASAGASFEPLIVATQRAQEAGRFDAGLDPQDVATQYWATGHGITSLTVTGVLTPADLRKHAPAAAIAVFIAAGDVVERATASVHRAWRRPASVHG
jgi:AcrR family transcriptional regulator